jgi:hypothetical protein
METAKFQYVLEDGRIYSICALLYRHNEQLKMGRVWQPQHLTVILKYSVEDIPAETKC